ncbi:MAG: branched-chain amino acid ABC transporter permease [Alphaproteobacteria bacterium]|nr:branched-chain amino acid ABC transporter permease [Alphaproteobacteria bacterium]MBM3951114.1 branched-chain amino acid ABC transporter permease [Rhodospirillales bacterium]
MTGELILQAVVSGLLMGLIYALVAVGLSLIFGLMEIVNFAHGEFLMLAMFASFWLWALGGLDPLLSLPLVAALLAGLGLATHYGIIRRVLDAPMLAQICATFGLAVALRAGAQYLWTPDFRVVGDPWIAGRVQVGPIFIGQPQLIAGFVCLAAFVALWLFVTRTETGLALQATSQDRQAAAIVGIPTDRMSALGWAIGLACVAVAGSMLSTFFYIFPDVGVNFALLAFVAVALGGFGSILGSLVAGVMIGLIESLGGLLISPSYKNVIVYALYLAVVLVRPMGLFGRF